jgi:hypothetical protein
MKFLQPEMLARSRSANDAVAEAAADQWDTALVAYRARFKAIRNRLPVAVRRLCVRVALHDALLLGAARAEHRPFFALLVRLEGTAGEPGEVLELVYHPVAGPHGGLEIRTHPCLDDNPPGQSVRVLYDEFDVHEAHAFFTHALLLSDGREIDIRFHSMTWRRLGTVFAPAELPQGAVRWPLVESVA